MEAQQWKGVVVEYRLPDRIDAATASVVGSVLNPVTGLVRATAAAGCALVAQCVRLRRSV